MWLFSKTGFVSVVQDRNDKNKLWVRARVKEDLVNFVECLERDVEVYTVAPSDYKWRATLSREELAQAVSHVVTNLDYDNFKGATHDDTNRDDAHMKVWSAMYGLQLDGIKPNLHRYHDPYQNIFGFDDPEVEDESLNFPEEKVPGRKKRRRALKNRRRSGKNYWPRSTPKGS